MKKVFALLKKIHLIFLLCLNTELILQNLIFSLNFDLVTLMFCFVAVPRTSLEELQSTVTTLPCTHYRTEVLDSLLSIPTHMWGIANKDRKQCCHKTNDVIVSIFRRPFRRGEDQPVVGHRAPRLPVRLPAPEGPRRLFLQARHRNQARYQFNSILS